MTCREKLAMEHPEMIKPDVWGGCDGCPNSSNYEYLTDADTMCVKLHRGPNPVTCTECWDQEIPETIKLDTNDNVSVTANCWTKDNPHILDSGNRTEFASGAVRDMREGKGRCDLLPLDVVAAYLGEFDDSVDWVIESISEFQKYGQQHYLYSSLNTFQHAHFGDSCSMLLEVAKHFEEGCKKYGENNWQKGIPTHVYVDSAVRHYLKFLRGDKDEPHDRAFCWNILCCIWTCKHKPELNTYAKKEEPVLKGVNFCVTCGREIPEGDMLCPMCNTDLGD